MKTALTVLCSAAGLLLGSCTDAGVDSTPAAYDYDVATSGTRRFEWDTETAPAWIKVLTESRNIGSNDVEIAEIFFPPEYQGTTHPHEFEIIYVIEGTLDHIVNGESNLLTPGMVGVVREPDLVVHRTASPEGVRVLVIWPLGGEVQGFEDTGMRESALD